MQYYDIILSGRTGGRADGRTSGQADGRTCGQADGRTSGQADGRTSGQADGRTGGQGSGVVRLFRSHHPDYPDGGQLRDFVFVDDCVDVMLWLLERPEVSGLFNLGSGTARSFADLARAIAAAAGQPSRIEFIPMPEAIRPNYQYFTQARMERLRGAGYAKLFTSLEDGVRSYVERYLSRPDRYR